MTDHDDIEPPHDASPTEHVLAELQLFGYRPFDDQPDPRPLPDGRIITGAVVDIFDALVATLSDTRLEPDLDACACIADLKLAFAIERECAGATRQLNRCTLRQWRGVRDRHLAHQPRRQRDQNRFHRRFTDADARPGAHA